MPKAFILGKFLPFHKGHEAMIRFALGQCDSLTVLVCASEEEGIPGTVRQSWLRETFLGESRIQVQLLEYKEDELPNTSASSRKVSQVWADWLKQRFPRHDAVISSEKYGDYLAEYMGIRHIPFDPPRGQVPISATTIRRDVAGNWAFLPGSVRPYFVKKVVLLGTESTGKSTLAQQLAQHFKATLVEEAGREIIPDSSRFEFNDLYRVAEAHAAGIQAAMRGESPLIIMDTDIHITQSYARFFFQRQLEVPSHIRQASQADLHLYLNADVPYVQDGTRMPQDLRDQLDASHRATLREAGVSIKEIRGGWEERRDMAIRYVEGLLGKMNHL